MDVAVAWQRWAGAGCSAVGCVQACTAPSVIFDYPQAYMCARTCPPPPPRPASTYARAHTPVQPPTSSWLGSSHPFAGMFPCSRGIPADCRTDCPSVLQRKGGGRGVICRHTSPPGRAARRAPGSRVRLRCMGAEVVRCAARRRVRALTGTGRARPRRTPLRARWCWPPAPRAGRLAASRSSSRALCCRC